MHNKRTSLKPINRVIGKSVRGRETSNFGRRISSDISTVGGEAAYRAEREEIDSLDQLMGLEDCNSGDDDEECAKRRMVAEAHLDYIYTQHRNP
ncbi:hypothetical protein RHSIM_Rhsim01G0208400 [Rhododendron simsii]|uniref:Phytosulfokine n=1 Tax=Rhododendron simsii TaxID=118357 RepID=A0A834HV10_RHOSS|nr:hypothetical protein RHSIM_Rhsim01G0208400 [Rhododendron simsii]